MALSVLYDKVQSYLRHVCSLGVTADNRAFIFMSLVSSSLPAEILRTWERKGRGAGSSSKVMLKSLMEFLKYEVEGDEKIAMALDGFGLTVLHNGAIEVFLRVDVVGSLVGHLWERSHKIQIIVKIVLFMLVTSMFTKDAKITDLRSLDTLGITDPSEKLSKIELVAATYQHFLDSVKINEEGRIEVRLRFIKNHPPLSTNYGLAMKRMNGAIEKLMSEGYYEAYRLVLNNWINEGTVEEVTEKLDDKS
ncbi:hypothetical protein ILUMI_03049, partial [Ignelater luminosus]